MRQVQRRNPEAPRRILRGKEKYQLGVRVRTQRHFCFKFAANAKGTVEPDHKGERIMSCGFHERLDSRHSLI